MSSDWGSFAFKWTAVPGNSQIVVPWDSTRGAANMLWTAVAAGAASLVPGPWRGKFTMAVVRYSILCTGQNVTLAEQVLTGNAGTAADWETQGAAGAATIAAGTTSVREFKPLAPDWRIMITAGATGPTLFTVWGDAAYSPSYGG